MIESSNTRGVLDAVWGNDALKRRLEGALRSRELPHALIIEGPRGSGKHTIATHLSAALHCTGNNRDSGAIPCLTCRECRRILEGKSPDLIRVGREEDKATIGVDTARFLREDVRIVPNDSDRKIYIIEDADTMTPQAQNAFLLTLEEPPAYVHFFLLCVEAERFLETIRSRAPVLRTEPLTREQIAEYLCRSDKRAEEMRRADPRGFAELIAASGAGIGQALSFLDSKVYAPVKAAREHIAALVRAAVEKKGAKVILPLTLKLSSKRDALSGQLDMLSLAVRDLILLKKSDAPSLAFFGDKEEALELCDHASLPFLVRLYEAIETAVADNGANINVRLLLTKLTHSADLL